MARLSRRDYALAGFLRPSDPLPGDPPWPWRHMMDMTPEEVAAFLATDPLGGVVDDSPEARERLVQDLNDAIDQEAPQQETVAPGDPRPDFWSTPSVFDHAILDLSQVQAAPISWLWHGRIPFGKVTILDGDPGLGKSTLLLDLAARLTTARPFPDQETARPEPVEGPFAPSPRRPVPASVLVLSAEDDLADTIRPHLEAAGADLTRVAAVPFMPTKLQHGPPRLSRDLARLLRLIRRTRARLVILDPLLAFLDRRSNPYSEQAIRLRLAYLGHIAQKLTIAIVLVRHLTKRTSRNPLYRGGGSIGIIGSVRAGLLVAPDPDDASGQRRVLATTKSNLGPMPPALAYRLVTAPNGAAAIQWEGPTGHTATSLLAGAAPNRDEDVLEDATTVLREILADGPMPATTVQREARQAGLCPHALRRAKAALGVRSRKLGVPGTTEQRWVWALPDRLGTPTGEDVARA